MAQFKLTADLITGVGDIDEQHRKLFSLADRLLETGESSGDRLAVMQALAFLGGYVDYHFAAEELAMCDSSYSGYVEHRTFHDSFREQVGDIAEEARNGAPAELMLRRVASLVTDWLLTHIRLMDRAFAEYLMTQATKNSIHLPSPDRLREAGLVPADYIVPDSLTAPLAPSSHQPGPAAASKSPSSS